MTLNPVDSTPRVAQAHGHLRAAGSVLAAVARIFAASSRTAAIDLTGPTDNVALRHALTVLPNGNFVVVDSAAQGGIGAVYVHKPTPDRDQLASHRRPFAACRQRRFSAK